MTQTQIIEHEIADRYRVKALYASRKTSDQAIADLGEADAARGNFISQMLLCSALDACDQVADLSREHRLSDIKQHCRRLRLFAEVWRKSLYSSMPREIADAYEYIVRSFTEYTAQQRWIATEKLRIDALEQVCRHPQTAAKVTWAQMLIKEIWAQDAKMDRLYPAYVNRDIRKAYRIVIGKIWGELQAIRRLGYDMIPTREALPAPGVIRNKAWSMAECLNQTIEIKN